MAMIPYQSRPGKFIRSILGGVIGGGLVTLLLMRAEAHAAEPAQFTGAALAQACEERDGWADPAPPAHVFGNTWYVGTCGITVLLITSDQGHVLIDGGPAEAAPLVAANIEKLGFKLSDVKWIVSSHEHDDHVGALAELKRLTGAKVAAIAEAMPALERGKPGEDDPQFAIANSFKPVKVDRVLPDRGTLTEGSLEMTVWSTPTHSPGSASWTWQSCDKSLCRTMSYADSATTISADGYRFLDHPQRIAAVEAGLTAIGALPCGILMTPHPQASAMFARFSGEQPLNDPERCAGYASANLASFAARQESERLKR